MERFETLADAVAALDSTIHSPIRFSAMSVLSRVGSIAYKSLRISLDISAPLLSKHLSILENAGLVEISKNTQGRITLTEVSITGAGRAAYARHAAALAFIAETE